MNVLSKISITIAFISMSAYSYGLLIQERKWDKSSINVCWVDKSTEIDQYQDIMEKLSSKRYNPTQLAEYLKNHSTTMPVKYKTHIQRVTNSEISVQKLGIEFIGWQSCDSQKVLNGDYDLLIIPENQPLSEKHPRELGLAGHRYLRGGKGSKIDYIEVNISQLETIGINKLTLIMLHEFGHALGLDHENIRSRKESDGFCLYYYWGGGHDYDATKSDPAHTMSTNPQALTSYDRFSVMNYCHLSTVLSMPDDFIHDLSVDQYRQIQSVSWETNLGPMNGFWKNLFGLQSKRITVYGSSLFRSQLYLKSQIDEFQILFNFQAKLSSGDIHTLKCAYDSGYKDNCQEQLNLFPEPISKFY
ncbi:hypothetical protein N9N67_05845 [Bacteriovoracaceae bacterium]|nr:hypothetical protein [Bacteriovoracaceae bacterium]